MLLEQIKGPEDIKKLSNQELQTLVDESREVLLQRVSSGGGHNGPNLGVVEMTVALHRVFNSPVDKLIFDISHQTYIHKMLTGRANAFLHKENYGDVSGYTNPKESDHDLFTVGHTSTSLSLASGIAKARDVKEENYNVVAIIGDGAMSGGLAYEGLNSIIELGTNTIVIVNDNNQSIAENHGGIYQNLKALRESNGTAEHNFFKAIGFEYHYLENGNDVEALVDLFMKVKDSNHPVLLHIHTIKGRGFKFAEENRERFHAGGPFSLETGEYVGAGNTNPTYATVATELIMEKMAKDPTVVVISAGTPMSIFNSEQRKIVGKQFVDVGIAEGQAATMTAGLAKNGAKPIWSVFSTFMQRSFDQISHDLALNDLSGTILVHSASINAMKDESHLGIFDIPFLSHIPNVIYLAPTNKEEYLAMLDWSIDQSGHPVAIRVPVGQMKESGVKDTTDYSQLFKSEVTNKGSQVVLMGLGGFYSIAEEVAKELQSKHNIEATMINPKFISGVDTELLDSLEVNHKLVVTLEDGILDGGYGQTVASYLGNSNLKVHNYGIEKAFHDRYNVDELLAENGITVENIVNRVVEVLSK